MSLLVPEADLPLELTAADALRAAYPEELAEAESALTRGLPVLVECDKELAPYFYAEVRGRLRQRSIACAYLDGRPQPGAEGPALGVIPTMIGQLRDAVRGPVGERVIVLPHLDLLTTGSGGLTAEAREVIPLLYENPQIVWLGFKDPSFPVPRVIAHLFARHLQILGTGRERLRHLVTQRESRKLGASKALDPYALYKHVSGVNAVRLRRLLSTLDGEDYPQDATPARAALRSATLGADFELPSLDLRRDVGGYEKVKERLEREILHVLAKKGALDDPQAIRRLEALVPRGMIFWGPPGTGKTLFAKAMASALGAAVLVVSGPELKSRWVGESEENLRQVFVRARQSAPSVIVFDELDSFAAARGTFTGSGVEHSMVNQLLTEMDGFRKEELVFVVGTTNLVEALDPALLRPGRFEFQLHVPFPDADDRRAILEVHDAKLGTEMSARALDWAVKRTGDLVEGTGTRYSGDHLQALCRQIARTRLREGRVGPTEPADVEDALTAYLERPELTQAEERVVATHEAGHAICALHCPDAPPIDRISIRGDVGGSLGFVRYADRARRYVVTRAQLLDAICVLFGGREAESLLLEDLSIGSAHDLERATEIARSLVCELGMGGHGVSVQRYAGSDGAPDRPLADPTKLAIDEAVRAMLEAQRDRAARIIREQQKSLEALRDLLLERKVLDAESLSESFGPRPASRRPPGGA